MKSTSAPRIWTMAMGFFLVHSIFALAQVDLNVWIANKTTAGTTVEFDIMAFGSQSGTKLGAIQVYLEYNSEAFASNLVSGGLLTASKGALLGASGYTNVSPVPTPLLHDNQMRIAALSVDFSGTCETAATLPPTAPTAGVLMHVVMTKLSAGAVDNVRLRTGSAQPSMIGQQFQCDNLTQYNVLLGTVNLVEADVKVFLQGPYSTGSMNAGLKNAGYVPLAQPYNQTPWSYGGDEAVSAIPDNVVDWVLVELRTGNPAAPPMTVAARRAGFMLNNGKIVDLNGTDKLQFNGVGPGSYYLVIRHRNHLAVMSSAMIDFSSGAAAYDFTTGQTKAYGTLPMQDLAGVFAMVAGDVSKNGQVKYSGAGNDRVLVLNAVGNVASGTLSGYHLADVNMNGQVKYSGAGNDRVIILNSVGNVASGTRNTQVPAP